MILLGKQVGNQRTHTRVITTDRGRALACRGGVTPRCVTAERAQPAIKLLLIAALMWKAEHGLVFAELCPK